MAFRRFCEAAAARRPIEIFGNGRQTRDFTFMADIARAREKLGFEPSIRWRTGCRPSFEWALST